MEEKKEKKSWGGARDGAGRPLTEGEPLDKRVIFRMTSTQHKELKKLCPPGCSLSYVVRTLVTEALEARKEG